MEEYTRAIFKDNNQTCIDYLTLQKYDTNYIQEGDILICSGDLSKKGYCYISYCIFNSSSQY